MSSSSSRAVDYSRVTRLVKVYGENPDQRGPERRRRENAARFIAQGLRVTDDYDRNLTIDTRPDGTQRIVYGEDPYGAYMERERNRTLDRAARAPDRPPRQLTDYESGTEHPEDCGILMCDHPRHFGGDPRGKLDFGKVEKKPGKDEEKKGGDKSGGGGAAGTTS